MREIELRIFIDRYVVEVFANDRQAVLEMCPGFAENKGLCAVSKGGSSAISELCVWTLKPANQGYLEAVKTGNWK